MKFLPIFILLLCTQISQAAPLVGFSTMEPANLYQIVNAKGVKIFSAIADTVKRVELRDGLAVVQTFTNNVSLIREDGTVIVDSVYGSELGISKKLLSIFNKGGIAAVYSLDGKKLFPAADESQTRPVQNIWIANERFAVLDKLTGVLSVYDLDGKELFTTYDSAKVLLSDGFLVAVSSLGTLSLYDAKLNLITTESGMTQIQVSDEFAGYVDNSGDLNLFSRKSGRLPVISGVSSFSLTNAFAMVKDSAGLTVYGKEKNTLELPSLIKCYSSSHSIFAYVGNTGALWVKNEDTGNAFNVSHADAYAMSDDLLVVKNGMADFTVYSLQKGSFGNEVHSMMDQTITQFQVGNGVVSFESTLGGGASNQMKVFYLSKSVMIDESPVNKVNLSVNREEWNWQ